MPQLRRQTGSNLVAAVAATVSVLSFIAFLQRDEVLLSGDAVAHIGIARRVFDSLTPGPFQLGTVWLPFQHLLTIPFIVNDQMWRSGVGGSIPSMIGYVLAAVGLFRLVWSALRGTSFEPQAMVAAWFSALVLIANPNLMYVQSTALNESLYLAEFIWAVVLMNDFVRAVSQDDPGAASRSLERCAIVLAAAILTRYDAWILTIACGLVMLVVVFRTYGLKGLLRPGRVTRAVLSFTFLCALTPALWMAYNYGIFQDPLDFARGPYSAQAIMERTMRPGDPFHPGYRSPWVASLYFLKAAKLNLSGAGHWEPWLLLCAVTGTLIALLIRRRILLLLWVPLPFYAYSIAYGAVPIFIPSWWPFSYYNTRYGLQLLPAVAAFVGVLLAFLLARTTRRWRAAVVVVFVVVVVGSYTSAWQQTPLCLSEVRANSRTRIAYEKALAEQLEALPPGSRLLMFVGDHFDALRRAGIPLRCVVNESNFEFWQPALDRPPRYVDYVIATEHGPVAQAAADHGEQLEPLVIINSMGQPRTTIYKTRRVGAADKIQPLSH